MKKPCLFVVLIFLTLLPPMAELHAQIPRTLSYQGVLTDSLGNPKPDGTYSITFRLYQDATGGSPIWAEAKTLQVTRGLFYTVLGDQVIIGPTLTFDRQYWLSIQVASEPELSPRTPLTSVGYSFNSLRADTSQYARITSPDTTWRTSGNNVYRLSGNVGIGTTGPTKKLEVVGSIKTSDTLFTSNVSSNSPLQLQAPAGTTRMFINDASGNVGIGTLVPARKLDIAGAGGFASSVRILNTASTGQSFLTLARSGGTVNEWLLGTDINAAGSGRDFWIHDNIAAATRLLVNASGNVGIGTTSPTQKLDVAGIGAIHMIAQTTSSSNVAGVGVANPERQWFLQVRGELGGAPFVIRDGTAGEYRLTINSTGNVGIGTVSPSNRLTVSGNADFTGNVGVGTTTPLRKLHIGGGTTANNLYSEVVMSFPDAGDHNLEINNTSGWSLLGISGSTTHLVASGNLRFSPGAGAAMTMTPAGNVGIGTTTPANILTIVQNSSTDPIADAWTTYSSRRWKKNIQPIDNALEKVQRLRGVSYEWKADGKQDIGLIAEEVGEVIPEVVAYEENSKDAKSVDYARLVALLIEGIKTQQKEIEELRAVVKSLVEQKKDGEERSLGELR